MGPEWPWRCFYSRVLTQFRASGDKRHIAGAASKHSKVDTKDWACKLWPSRKQGAPTAIVSLWSPGVEPQSWVTCNPHLSVYPYIQLTLEQHKFELCRSTYMWIFSISKSLALHISRFCICNFNQPWIKNRISSLSLGVWGCRGPTICIVLCYFYIRDLNILRFWYPQGSWNQSSSDTERLLGSQKLFVDFQLHP